MRRSTLHCKQPFQQVVKRFPRMLTCHEYGEDILSSSLWNKGLAFDMAERDRLGLRGLLPPAVRNIDDQCKRSLERLSNLPDDLARSIHLRELHGRNETLFHRLLLDNIETIAPLVYTPTVGLVCQKFGNQFARARGMFFSTQDRGLFSTMIHNWDHDDVHVVVVTDGSRILGLGDLGAQGMGIPIGKLALYCACGGIAPHRVLPVTLDVGTNNKALLDDPDYIGMRHPRLDGQEYYDMVDEFMSAVYARYPNVVVQFEDFETSKAVPLLEKYQKVFRCFNDDIQGTGAVTLAAVIGGAKVAKRPFSSTRVLCLGAGSAGIGVCSAVLDGLIQFGVESSEAKKQIVIADNNGVIGRPDGVHGNPHYHNSVIRDHIHLPWVNWDISDGTPVESITETFKPNVLLGLTATKGVFTESLIRAVTKGCVESGCERPIIMPLSNPTSKAECTSEEAVQWSDGRAIVATGSPSKPFEWQGRTYFTSQCNNMYVFPGLGLAASVGGLKTFSDSVMFVAARAIADSASDIDIDQGRLFPHITSIRDVAAKVATDVLTYGFNENLTTTIKKHHMREGLENYVRRKMYYPNYVPIRSTGRINH